MQMGGGGRVKNRYNIVHGSSILTWRIVTDIVFPSFACIKIEVHSYVSLQFEGFYFLIVIIVLFRLCDISVQCRVYCC